MGWVGMGWELGGGCVCWVEGLGERRWEGVVMV